MEHHCETTVEKQVEHHIDVPVYRDRIIEKITEVPVTKLVEKYVPNIIKKPVYRERVNLRGKFVRDLFRFF